MNFTIDKDLEVIRYGFNASASGDGDIYIVIHSGEIVVEVEQYLGDINIVSCTHYTDIVDGKQTTTNLDDFSIEIVNSYIRDCMLLEQYMDEVYEAINQER